MLPFLDTSVKRKEKSLVLVIPRKETNSKKYLHFQSVHFKHVKTRVAKPFINRALKLTTGEELKNEVKEITQIMKNKVSKLSNYKYGSEDWKKTRRKFQKRYYKK